MPRTLQQRCADLEAEIERLKHTTEAFRKSEFKMREQRDMAIINLKRTRDRCNLLLIAAKALDIRVEQCSENCTAVTWNKSSTFLVNLAIAIAACEEENNKE